MREKPPRPALTANLRETEPLIFDILFYMEGGWRLSWGMAIYRCEARIISREKRGHSVVAASAYRAGLKLKDEHSGKMHDYSRRSKGVVETAIVGPDNAPG